MKQNAHTFHIPWLGQIISILILVALGLWLTTGTVHTQPNKPDPFLEASPHGLTTVTAEYPQEKQLQPTLKLYGQTEAQRTTILSAQREAVVLERLAKKGDSVHAGDVLARLDPRDLPAQITAAKASVAEQQTAFNAAQRLKKQDLVGQAHLAQVASLLASAQANLQKLEVESRLLNVTAPFAGTIDAHHFEVGDLVQVGKPLFDLVTINPLKITAEITENALPHIHISQDTRIFLRNGTELSGTVHFIGAQPNPKTRTYPIEIQTQSPASLKHIGMSAIIELHAPSQAAYLISPGLLQVNEEGKLGVKTLVNLSSQPLSAASENRATAETNTTNKPIQAPNTPTASVSFQPVEVLQTETKGIWVSGISPQIAVITIGQGYVNVGERVYAHIEPSVSPE